MEAGWHPYSDIPASKALFVGSALARCSDKAYRLKTGVAHHWACLSLQSTFCCPRHLQLKDWPFPSPHSLCFLPKPQQYLTMMVASRIVRNMYASDSWEPRQREVFRLARLSVTLVKTGQHFEVSKWVDLT